MSNDDVGLGIDIVEIARIAKIMSRSPAFIERVYTEDERVYCRKSARPATRFAARFAAKEAVLKALGTGFSHGICPQDVEIVSQKGRPPRAVLYNKARERAQDIGVVSLPISLSYSRNEAIACAMAITHASLESEKRRKDPKDELLTQFKHLRSTIDEIGTTPADATQDDDVQQNDDVTQNDGVSQHNSVHQSGDVHQNDASDQSGVRSMYTGDELR